MAIDQPVAIHERLGIWARQIRPHFASRPLRVVETRSRAELLDTCTGVACPILVVDLKERPRVGLDDLEQAIRIAPNALSLVIDPAASPEVRAVALEMGGTLVFSGWVAPPRVLGVLTRWVSLAGRRAEADGWAPRLTPDLEPWETLLAEHTEARLPNAGDEMPVVPG